MGCAPLMASSVSSPLKPRAREIVAAARILLEQEGPEGLSMRRLAERLGVRAPSLYKHLADKGALEAAIISEALAEQADAFEAALSGAADPLAQIGAAYRAFALAHPHLYRLINERPLAREQLVPGVEDRAARALVQAVGGDPDRARAAWAFAHGMVNLELNGRFPPGADLAAAWRQGIDAFRLEALTE